MKREQILENLCVYDKKNPDNQCEWGEASQPCFCDNCFYGRTDIAKDLLKAIDIIDNLTNHLLNVNGASDLIGSYTFNEIQDFKSER